MHTRIFFIILCNLLINCSINGPERENDDEHNPELIGNWIAVQNKNYTISITETTYYEKIEVPLAGNYWKYEYVGDWYTSNDTLITNTITYNTEYLDSTKAFVEDTDTINFKQERKRLYKKDSTGTISLYLNGIGWNVFTKDN